MITEDARPVCEEALFRVLGRKPELEQVYILQAVARFDGGYGNFRSPPHGPEGPESNNWGAVQHPDLVKHRIWRGSLAPRSEVASLLSEPAPASLNSEWFFASDYYGSPHGQGWFWGPYRRYATPVDGACHVARLLNRMGVLQVAVEQTSVLACATQMRAHNYFVGYDEYSREQNIVNYAKNLIRGCQYFEKVFEEASPLSYELEGLGLYYIENGWTLPTLKIGARGDGVKLWQKIIGAIQDGVFGPQTRELTLVYQVEHGLEADGIVGPITWATVK